MKKTFTLLAAAVAVLAMSAPQTASAETLRVGMECTYAPFNFKNADGNLDGYDVDVAKGVAGLIGADLDFVCQKWDGMIPALLANKFDIVVASMSITDKRLKKMDFSDTYRISVGRLVGRKDAGWKLFDDGGKPIPASFAGLKVGLERATTYSAVIIFISGWRRGSISEHISPASHRRSGSSRRQSDGLSEHHCPGVGRCRRQSRSICARRFAG